MHAHAEGFQDGGVQAAVVTVRRTRITTVATANTTSTPPTSPKVLGSNAPHGLS